MTLIEKVAMAMWEHEFRDAPGLRRWDDEIPEAQEHFRQSAQVAIAVVLKDQIGWNIRIGWADRPIIDYARENGVSLNDPD